MTYEKAMNELLFHDAPIRRACWPEGVYLDKKPFGMFGGDWKVLMANAPNVGAFQWGHREGDREADDWCFAWVPNYVCQ